MKSFMCFNMFIDLRLEILVCFMGLFLMIFLFDQILIFIINNFFYGDNMFMFCGILIFKFDLKF